MSFESQGDDPAAVIRALAARYQVAYAESAHDVLGRSITRLAGDAVELDGPELLLLALERAGHVSPTDAMKLHAHYLRHVSSHDPDKPKGRGGR